MHMFIYVYNCRFFLKHDMYQWIGLGEILTGNHRFSPLFIWGFPVKNCPTNQSIDCMVGFIYAYVYIYIYVYNCIYFLMICLCV